MRDNFRITAKTTIQILNNTKPLAPGNNMKYSHCLCAVSKLVCLICVQICHLRRRNDLWARETHRERWELTPRSTWNNLEINIAHCVDASLGNWPDFNVPFFLLRSSALPIIIFGIWFYLWIWICFLFISIHIENASRFCHANGTWDKANYDQCKDIVDKLTDGMDIKPHVELATNIYGAGYTLSLVALSLGLAVFIHFKWVILEKKNVFNLFENHILPSSFGRSRIVELNASSRNCRIKCYCFLFVLQRSSLFAQHNPCKSIFNIYSNGFAVADTVSIRGEYWWNFYCFSFFFSILNKYIPFFFKC